MQKHTYFGLKWGVEKLFLMWGWKIPNTALDLISHCQRKSENHSPQHLLILSTGVFVSAMAPAGFNMAIMSRLHRALHARVSSPRSARSLLHQVQSKVDQGAEWQDMQGSPCGTGCWPTKALCGQSGSRCLVIPSGKQGCKRCLGTWRRSFGRLAAISLIKAGVTWEDRGVEITSLWKWEFNLIMTIKGSSKILLSGFFSLRGWYPPIPVPP